MKALILCFSLFLTLPAWAETLTLANGQRCTVLSNGRLGGCTAPTNDRDRSDTRPQYPAYGPRAPTFAEPKTRQIAPAGWTPKY